MTRVKIATFVPINSADEVRKAFGKAGAGIIGDYTYCSFSFRGMGRFIPSKDADPTIGEKDEMQAVEEEKIEVVCQRSDAKKVINAMKKVHPYEEVAFEMHELLDEEHL